MGEAPEDDARGAQAPGGSRAFAEERQARILTVVAERGRIRTVELAELLEVAEPTVRRDIADLDRRQLLRRTHGGAMALDPAHEPALSTRAGIRVEAKRRIARACLERVSDGDSIFLDSGTTVEAIADLLTEPAQPLHVNVLTNALGSLAKLAEAPRIRHTVLGGQYRPLGGCLVGPLAVESLQSFTVNTAFIGVTGLSDIGFTVSDLGDAQLKSAAIDRARTVVVAMDASKVGANDFRKLCDLDRAHVVVTDRHHPWLASRCADAGVELVVADR